MKIAFITDNHFDERHHFEETIRVHHWIADDAAARGCSMTILGGDLFERKSTATERNAAGDWLLRMAELGRVVGVYGNHEAPHDLDLFNLLESRHSITFHASPAVVRDGVSIMCLPWPRKAHLLAGTDAGREEADREAATALQSVLRGLALDVVGPSILLAHAQVRASRVSTGQPLVGCDFELGIEDLALARADAYALGHVHLPQEWDIAGAPCFYGGSPTRTSFGEVEVKSYTVLEFDVAGLVGWERVPTPCTPMHHVELWWHSESGDVPAGFAGRVPDGLTGDVRLRYHVAREHRDAARAAAQSWRDLILTGGASSVKVEEQIVVETRARMPEVAAAVTTADKLEQFWRAKGFDPGERRPQLLSKFHEIESHRSVA
jgi:exonuclease SbcD